MFVTDKLSTTNQQFVLGFFFNFDKLLFVNILPTSCQHIKIR